jgi:hypothetical protein
MKAIQGKGGCKSLARTRDGAALARNAHPREPVGEVEIR